MRYFEKLAELSTKEKVLYPAAGVATGAVAGGTYSWFKPQMKGRPRIEKARKTEFIKKLKPGDVLLTGSYKLGPETGDARYLQVLIHRNQTPYHTAVYLGRGKFTDLTTTDAKKPRGRYYRRNLKEILSSEGVKAFRSNMSRQEKKEFLNKLDKNLRRYTYSSPAATKAYILDNLGIKYNCKGNFCSNAITRNMPSRLFKNKTTVMPTEFASNKNFKEVAKLVKHRTHLPLSNSSLKRYVLPGAAVGGILGYAGIKI